MAVERNRIAVPDSLPPYHIQLFEDSLKSAFPDTAFSQARIGAHPDGSPIPVVGSGDRVIMFQIMEGDNWQKSFSESIVYADAFTAQNGKIEPNAKEFGIFFIDLEGRRDRLDEKIPLDSLERFAVKGQGIPIRALARSLHANGTSFVLGINDHSSAIHALFENAGIRHIPLSSEAAFIDHLIARGELTRQNIHHVVLGTTDIGGLKEASSAKRHIDARFGQDIPVAVIYKYHVPTGVDFITEKKSSFISGDVKDKFVLVIDDRTDSASTVMQAVDIYKEQGAAQVGIYITHPVFADARYYNNIRKLLADPKVAFVSVSNSLPMGQYRFSRTGGVNIPYTDSKKLSVVDIHPWIITVTKALIESPSVEDAIKQFDVNHWLLDMRDPYDIYESLTRASLPTPKTVGYYEDSVVYKFEE